MAQYKTLNNFANEFSSSTSYAVGDLVMYLGELYVCSTTHNVGSWNSADFTKTSVATQLANAGGGIPTVTIELAQVVSQTPVQIQLTNDQYNIFANNKQVIIDVSALGLPVVVWNYTGTYAGSDGSAITYGFNDSNVGNSYNRISIDTSTKIATYYTGEKYVSPNYIGYGDSAYEGKLLAMDSSGWGTLTNALPIITTAPSSANTNGLIICVLSSEPATKYSGYLYIITGA